MKFTLKIDPNAEETVAVTVRCHSPLVDQLEAIVTQGEVIDRVTAYMDDDMVRLKIRDIACISITGGKTFAVDRKGVCYRLKQRLYELEQMLPACFIRINKSALANENHLERFQATFSGGVDAIFTGGHREYVSRRCFSEIKRRYEV